MAIGNTGLSIIACTVASSVNKLKFYIHVEMCQPTFFPQYFPNPRSQTSSLFCQQLRRGGLAQGWPMREEDKKYRPMGSQL